MVLTRCFYIGFFYLVDSKIVVYLHRLTQGVIVTGLIAPCNFRFLFRKDLLPQVLFFISGKYAA